MCCFTNSHYNNAEPKALLHMMGLLDIIRKRNQCKPVVRKMSSAVLQTSFSDLLHVMRDRFTCYPTSTYIKQLMIFQRMLDNIFVILQYDNTSQRFVQANRECCLNIAFFCYSVRATSLNAVVCCLI